MNSYRYSVSSIILSGVGSNVLGNYGSIKFSFSSSLTKTSDDSDLINGFSELTYDFSFFLVNNDL